MPFASDTFTEGSDASLINHAPDTGGTWIEKNDTGTGEATIEQSIDCWKRTQTEVGDNCTYVLSTCPVSSSYRIHSSVSVSATLGSSWYIFGRYNGLSSLGYAFVMANPALNPDTRLYSRVDGVNSLIGSTDVGIAAGDTYDLDILPASQICYKNGTIIIQAANTAASVAGRVGMGQGNLFYTSNIVETWRLDNFQVDEFEPYPGANLRLPNQTVYRM